MTFRALRAQSRHKLGTGGLLQCLLPMHIMVIRCMVRRPTAGWAVNDEYFVVRIVPIGLTEPCLELPLLLLAIQEE